MTLMERVDRLAPRLRRLVGSSVRRVNPDAAKKLRQLELATHRRLGWSGIAERDGHRWAALPSLNRLHRPWALQVDGIAETAVGRYVLKGGIGAFEPETLSILLALIDVEDATRYLDVGANVGIFPVVAKALRGDRVDVRGYEPLPSLVDIAVEFGRINDIEVDIRQQALSDQAGTGTLFVSASTDSSNSLNPTFRQAKGTIEVELLTLDSIGAEFRPDLVKIDTESTEPDVLRGGERFIAEHRPWIVCEVLKGRTEAALTEFAERHDYRFYHLNERPLAVTEKLAGDPTYQYRDWLLAPRPVTAELNRRYLRWVVACRRATSPSPTPG